MQLTSARLGEDAPAHWVHTCSCPPGYEGQFCERCSAGFTRSSPADGAFSRCRPCDCSGGSCDTVTGDCYSADQTSREPSCPRGFYRDPWLSRTCSRCPCPEGVPCSVEAGSATPRCERCPSGTTGGRLHHEFVLSHYLRPWVGNKSGLIHCFCLKSFKKSSRRRSRHLSNSVGHVVGGCP